MEYPERIFKRKIYDRIQEWKRTKDGSTALLIKGVRRVGKSTMATLEAGLDTTKFIFLSDDSVGFIVSTPTYVENGEVWV